jgi:hypothetical protein
MRNWTPIVVDFVTRHSLELFASTNAVGVADAESLRATYRRIGDGPRDVKTWVITFAYAAALAQTRKPGARAASRASSAYAAASAHTRRPGARIASQAPGKRRQQQRSR